MMKDNYNRDIVRHISRRMVGLPNSREHVPPSGICQGSADHCRLTCRLTNTPTIVYFGQWGTKKQLKSEYRRWRAISVRNGSGRAAADPDQGKPNHKCLDTGHRVRLGRHTAHLSSHDEACFDIVVSRRRHVFPVFVFAGLGDMCEHQLRGRLSRDCDMAWA